MKSFINIEEGVRHFSSSFEPYTLPNIAFGSKVVSMQSAALKYKSISANQLEFSGSLPFARSLDV